MGAFRDMCGKACAVIDPTVPGLERFLAPELPGEAGPARRGRPAADHSDPVFSRGAKEKGDPFDGIALESTGDVLGGDKQAEIARD
jgi:hypothetical protein